MDACWEMHAERVHVECMLGGYMSGECMLGDACRECMLSACWMHVWRVLFLSQLTLSENGWAKSSRTKPRLVVSILQMLYKA